MKKSGNPSLSVFTIASAYIGTVVGAGFASGQEVLQFFSAYGRNGLWGVALVTVLFFFFGYSVLLLGRSLNARSHVEIVHFTNGRYLGAVIDLIITIFLFGALSAMIAGAGAIFDEQFGISPPWGTTLMAVVSFLTVLSGTRGVINAISYVVPFLIVSVLFMSVFNLAGNPITHDEIVAAKDMPGATPNWLIAGINYASYNMVIAIAVLTPMGAEVKSRKTLFLGALLGALGLGVGILAIYLAVLTNIHEVRGMEVPMIQIASDISGIVRLIFSIVLFAEVYTTAVGNLYGFVQRINTRLRAPWVIAAVTGLAFIASQFGFSNMVRYLYPAVGYGGMLFFGGVMYAWFAKRDAFI